MKIQLNTYLSAKQSIAWLVLTAALAVTPALRATLPSTTSSNLTVVYPATVGTVTTGQSGTTLNITSTAPTTVLNWANFWDGTANGGSSQSGDVINYALPGATSSILNNVSATGGATTISGAITSNGKVFLLNPSGITISATGSINAAGFYASTVPENLSYFEQNGTLQVFSSTPPAATTSGSIDIEDPVSIQTVGGGGDVRLAANGFTINGTINGNTYIVDTGAPAPVIALLEGGTFASTTSGGVTVGGNLTISSNGGKVRFQGHDGDTTVMGNLVINSAGGNVEVSDDADTTVLGSTSINTVGATTNGNVYQDGGTLTSAGLTIVTGNGSSSTDGNIDIDAGGVYLGSNPLSITGGGSGGVTIYDDNDTTLVLGNSTISGTLSIENDEGAITTQNFGSTSATPAAVTMTSATNNGIDLFAEGKISFNGSGAENFTELDATDATTLTTTGNLALNTGGTVNIATLSLASTGGSITQSASTPITATTLTVNGATVTLNSATNAFSDVVLQGGSVGGISLTDAASTLEIGDKTSTTGNVTIVNNGATLTGNSTAIIQLGDSATSVLNFGGNVSLTANAGSTGTPVDTITSSTLTSSQDITIAGKTTLTTGTTAAVAGNSITLGSASPSAATAYTFTGPISATAGNGGAITLGDNSGLVLGTITTTGNFAAATNLTGTGNAGISNPTGTVTVGGTASLTAGTSASAASNIQVGGTANPAAITGDITIGAANNLSLTNSLATTIGATTNAVKGQTSITETAAATDVDLTGSFANLSVTDPSGSVSVANTGGITLSNFAVGGAATTVDVSATGPITLGAGIADSNTGATTLTSTGSTAGISDTANSPVSIYGAVTFSSDGAINVGNNTASNLGGVSLVLTTGAGANNNNITYTEGGGVNLQAIDVGSGTYSGTVAITSVNSIILDTATSNLSLPASSKLNLTANSAGGAVLLNNPLAATDAIAAPVTISATGNSAILSSTDLILDGVAVTTGTFAASTGSSGGNITEATGTTIYSYANDSFTTEGELGSPNTGVITLGQSGNNFGAITIDTTNGGNSSGSNATIKEYGGNNYASVNTGAGSFSATSEQSIILQTGNAGIQVGGNTTLSAPNGSITLNATGNLFNGGVLLITTPGNASITDGSGTTVVGGGTNVGGNLTVSNISADGIIQDNGTTGNVTVGGIGAFLVPTSGSGDINFTGANNSIASIELKAGSGQTTFYDNTSVAVVPGTVVSGAANISSGGNISITQSGPATFASTLSLNANGNITVSDTSALFNQKVTAVVTGATSDVNFSALSLATNFNNVAPAVTTTNNATYYQAPGP